MRYLVLHVGLSTILYKLTVPAVRTTDDAERKRPREHVPEAASSQQHVAEGGLVSPSCCSAVTVTVKRRTEHSVFDISLSTDILRHSVSRETSLGTYYATY